MQRFFSKHYDSVGATIPTSSTAFSDLVLQYAVPSKLIRDVYDDNISGVLSNFYTTPTSSLIIITGDITLPHTGLYTFNVSAISGAAEVFMDNIVIASSFTNGGVTSVTLNSGVYTIKFIYTGLSSTGSYNFTWKEPNQLTYTSIPIALRPIYGYSLFKYTLYNSIEETINKDYTIVGQQYQLQTATNSSDPYKRFSVTCKQDNILDRADIKDWFFSVKGKYKAFMFNSRKSEFIVYSGFNGGSTNINVSSSFSEIGLSFVKRLIYIPSVSFFTTITGVTTTTDNNYGICEELTISEPLPVGIESDCPVINFLYLCRLDTDTLSFELEDINFSTVKLSIIELYNDYQLIKL